MRRWWNDLPGETILAAGLLLIIFGLWLMAL